MKAKICEDFEVRKISDVFSFPSKQIIRLHVLTFYHQFQNSTTKSRVEEMKPNASSKLRNITLKNK